MFEGIYQVWVGTAHWCRGEIDDVMLKVNWKVTGIIQAIISRSWDNDNVLRL